MVPRSSGWMDLVERERTRSAARARAAAGKSEWLAGDHSAAARRISATASPSPRFLCFVYSLPKRFGSVTPANAKRTPPHPVSTC